MADRVATAREALPMWLASIPDPISPAAGRDAAQRALDDADTVLRNIKLSFEGTVPPPPWPATPAVDQARADVETARDGFATLADRSVGIKLTWPKSTGKYGPMLVRVGSTLYTRLAELEERAATSDSLPDLINKLKDLPRPLAGLSMLLLLGGAFLAYREFRSVRRLLEGT